MNRAQIIRERLNKLADEELALRREKQILDRPLQNMSQNDLDVWADSMFIEGDRATAIDRRLEDIRVERLALNAEYHKLPPHLKDEDD